MSDVDICTEWQVLTSVLLVISRRGLCVEVNDTVLLESAGVIGDSILIRITLKKNSYNIPEQAGAKDPARACE
jgi:hypothetical protein